MLKKGYDRSEGVKSEREGRLGQTSQEGKNRESGQLFGKRYLRAGRLERKRGSSMGWQE